MPTVSRNELKTDFDVLIDLQKVYQITKAELNQYRQYLAVSVKIAVGSAYNADFSDTQHFRECV